MDSLVELKNQYEDFFVKFEAITPKNYSDIRKVKIEEGLAHIDEQLDELEEKLNLINEDIARLTNTADGLDYTIAVCSGVLAGIVDILFIDGFSFENLVNSNEYKTIK